MRRTKSSAGARADAERPWFVRTGGGGRCRLRPASPAGWALTLVYGAIVGGISLYFLGRADPGAAEIAAWAALMAAATFGYLLIAWRTAATVDRGGGCARRKGTASDARLTLLVALATAAALIGAALLGIDL